MREISSISKTTSEEAGTAQATLLEQKDMIVAFSDKISTLALSSEELERQMSQFRV